MSVSGLAAASDPDSCWERWPSDWLTDTTAFLVPPPVASVHESSLTKQLFHSAWTCRWFLRGQDGHASVCDLDLLHVLPLDHLTMWTLNPTNVFLFRCVDASLFEGLICVNYSQPSKTVSVDLIC